MTDQIPTEPEMVTAVASSDAPELQAGSANLQTLAQSPQEAPSAPQDTEEVFPRAYVEKLRQEAAEARVKAKRAEDYAQQLFLARVAATGRLADPSDLGFDQNLLDDPLAIEAAIDELLGHKPHLASRTPRGNIGQGATASSTDVDLAAILRRGA